MNIIFDKIITAIIIAGVVSVFIAVFVDFALFNNKNDAKKSKKSIVATGTMTGFYLVYYMLLRLKIGSVNYNGYTIIIIGTIMIAAGAVFNILGRLKLRDNWANHIKIYNNHTLVTVGVYKIVRHPLYSSIMLMLLGGSLAYRNWLCAVLTALVFIPFMYYRAKQEEKLLESEFEEYKIYKNKTGMFFPKITLT